MPIPQEHLIFVEQAGKPVAAHSTKTFNFCRTGILPVAALFEETSITSKANPESAC